VVGTSDALVDVVGPPFVVDEIPVCTDMLRKLSASSELMPKPARRNR
jgi:hypothetical protein